MTSRTIVIAVALACSPARADTELALEPSLGGVSHIDVVLGSLDLAATWQRPASELRWRGALVAGQPLGDVTGGHLWSARLGVEHLSTHCGRGCFYEGIDLAYIDAAVRDWPDEADVRGVLGVLRGGIDVGGDAWRLRFGIELSLGIGRVHEYQPDLVVPVDATSTRVLDGAALTTAVVREL
jgi:hypothetical protein